MQSRWDEEDLIRRTQASPRDADRIKCAHLGRALGFDPRLAMHGGGNVSLKTTRPDPLGSPVAVLLMKSTGRPLASMDVDDLCVLRLEPLRRLRHAEASDEAVAAEILSHRLDADGPRPSIETSLHALLPGTYVAHTHPEAVIALGALPDGVRRLAEAVGDEAAVLPYVKPGLELAQAGADALERNPTVWGLVLQHHGLVTWGDTAREAHDRMFALLDRVEDALEAMEKTIWTASAGVDVERAREGYRRAAPSLRRALSLPTGSPDRAWRGPVLRLLQDEPTLSLLGTDDARALLESHPVTADTILHVGPWPAWIEADPAAPDLHDRICRALEDDDRRYEGYLQRHGAGARPPASRPRVVAWPGIGVVCAAADAIAADRARDLMAQALRVKRAAAERGGYVGLTEAQAFAMEFCPVQRHKLDSTRAPQLLGRVALVTGAAGAIGSAVVDALLAEGAHVVITDLPDPLSAEQDRRAMHGCRVALAPMDVTDEASVRGAFDASIDAFGGIDLVVVNAGLAHVASLETLDLAAFRRLESVNVEGTLLVLAEASRRFREQGTGGDVVVVSTKNVFAPGAEFGAYSATKAAAHQLARVASLELAPIDVRVNLVAPDAVFAHGGRRSGLWAEVGPSRMKARGLNESELESFYRQRNLLKTTVRADHVARAVIFFATRQTPTTGATLPVDGGLPDATPR